MEVKEKIKGEWWGEMVEWGEDVVGVDRWVMEGGQVWVC